MGKAFRSAAMHAAYQYRISGFIRYDDQNSLTMEAQGESEDARQFIQYCRDWLSSCNLEDFIISDKEPEPYKGFEILRNIAKPEEPVKNQRWFQKIKDIIRM